MQFNKWGALGVAGLMLVSYNLSQPGLLKLRNNETRLKDPFNQNSTNKREGYGPSLEWLDRLARSAKGEDTTKVKLNFSVLSSLMVAGLASGFRSQVANLLWMKSDEYWHEGLFTRQVPLMEAVVTLDPQFIDAWSTAGWHWAYNIYADIPSNPDYKDKGEYAIRKAQENAVETGLDYLNRGSAMNPDTYRLWFEYGWTRAEKAGYYDDETVRLYRMARKQSDARIIETTGANGQSIKQNNGLDILGRTIGHLYERIPRFHQALDHYAGDLMGLKADSPDRKLLDENGRFWGLYGSDYTVIGDVYTKGDAVTKAQVKKLVPDVEELVKAVDARNRIASQRGRDQPVGAYVSITARYMPAQRLADKGDLQGAIDTINGVMNANTKYHLQRLATMAKIYELQGDAPAAIQGKIAALKAGEQTSSQDLGLHFLAKLAEQAEAAAGKKGDTAEEKKLAKLAYDTWYRSRSRDALDFYALRNTRLYEDKYHFTEPKDIVKQIKDSRKGGVPNAAPKDAPSIGSTYR
ncbi:hypothetical protein EON83_05530 [bacterium]|nr:MAG: hypothetical protein EON83_05530 [bacterium]